MDLEGFLHVAVWENGDDDSRFLGSRADAKTWGYLFTN